MRMTITIASIATLSLLLAVGVMCQGTGDRGTSEAHPRVLLTSAQVADLQAKAGNATQNRFGFDTKTAWEVIKQKADQFVAAEPYSYSVNIPLAGRKYAGEWSYTLSDETPPRHDDTPAYPPWTAMFQERPDSITTRLMHLSFAALVTGEDKYFQRAKKIALHLSNWERWTDISYSAGSIKACLDTGHCTYAMAAFYDWCYGMMTPAEREQVRQAIIDKGIAACLADVDRYPADTNGYAVILSGATLGSIAVAPETPEADEWIATCITKVETSLDKGGEDGGTFEGPMYGTYLIDSLSKAIEALEVAGIDHGLFDHPYLSTMERYCIGLMAPDTRQLPGYGDGSPTAGFPQIMSVLAHRGSSDAAWYLEQTGNIGISSIYDFIRFDAQKLNVRQPAWNPSSVFVDIGQASLRDGYNSDAPSLFIKSGPYSNNIGHNHFDHNSFVISYGGDWVIPDRGYHSRYDPAERKFSLGTMGHCTVVLDADEEYFASTEAPAKGHEQIKRTGGKLTEFFPGSAFDYVKGEAAEAYNSDDLHLLDRFDREILYLKPHFFVVHDRLAAPEAHSFNFLLHSDGLGMIELDDAGRFAVSRTTAQVIGQVMSSAGSKSIVETYPGAERYGPYLRVETEPATETTFTAVMYPRPNLNPEFIRNGGFESGMAGWTPRAGEDLPNHKIVEEDAPEGGKCARIDTSGYYYSDKFSLPVGAQLTASAQVRTEGVPQGKGANLYIYFWRAGKAVANKSTGPINHEGWQKHEITAVVPEGADQVSFALTFHAPGTAWFDDARVTTDVELEESLTPDWRACGPNALDITLAKERFLVSFGEGGSQDAASPLVSDADVAALTLDENGRPVRLFVKNGTQVSFADRVLFRSDEPVTAELVLDGDALQARVTDDVTPHAPVAESAEFFTGLALKQAVVNGRKARVDEAPDGNKIALK